MGQIDFCQPVKKIRKEMTFDFKEFCAMLESWTKERGYFPFIEADHSDKSTADGGRKIEISFIAEKKVDPYVKILMKLGISAEVKDVSIEHEGKKKSAQEGSIEVAIGGCLKKDSDDDWAVKDGNIFWKFVRDFYDKFFGKDKLGDAESRLSSDIKAVIHDIKTYLKLHRFD